MTASRQLGVAVLGVTMLATLIPSEAVPAVASTPFRTCVNGQQSLSGKQVRAITQLARRKISAGMQHVGVNSFPSGALAGSSVFDRTSRYGWTSGFFPAEVWMMYQSARTKSVRKVWLARARRVSEGLLPLASYDGSHDLGFMVGLPIGLAMQLDPSGQRRARYRSVYLQAADSLARRWNPNVGALRSGTYEGQWGLIVDSAMNAPFLIRAGKIAGGAAGRELVARGQQHMSTLARHFIRPDGSTFHRLTFDTNTGALLGPTPGQGLNGSSTWSRGQAWAMYGFTQAYTLTGDQQFLKVATKATDYWLRQLPNGCVPAWDFDVRTPNAPRDASASAIAAAGLLQLARATPSRRVARKYRRSASVTLGLLAGPGWSDPRTSNPGILQHQSHAIPVLAREGSYTWGDAYFLQALLSRDSVGRW